jgi:hypothetical protein
MRAAATSATVRTVAPPSPESIDIATAKSRARRAWLAAKRHQVAPLPLLDRWHADTLVAIEGAPEYAAIVMLGPSEVLFKLLLDRLRWLDRPE